MEPTFFSFLNKTLTFKCMYRYTEIYIHTCAIHYISRCFITTIAFLIFILFNRPTLKFCQSSNIHCSQFIMATPLASIRNSCITTWCGVVVAEWTCSFNKGENIIIRYRFSFYEWRRVREGKVFTRTCIHIWISIH